MRILMLFWALPAFCQYYLPHIADPNGSFTTTVSVTNGGDEATTVILKGYTSGGTYLGETSLVLGEHVLLDVDPVDTFGTRVSHIAVETEAPDVSAFTTYQADVLGAAPASASWKQPAPRWRLLPGDWELAWDGLAVVNVSDSSTSVLVRQYDASGAMIESYNFGTLDTGEKALLVFSTTFEAVADSYFEVVSFQDQDLVVTALRGSPDGTTLWENASLGSLPSMDTPEEDPLIRAMGLWTFVYQISSIFEQSYGLADIGTVDGLSVVFGTGGSGDLVAVGYENGMYLLYDPGTFLDRFFHYEIDESGTLANGCYYQGRDGEITSSCYTSLGVKLELNSKRKRKRAKDIDEPILPPGNPSPEVVAMGRKLHRAWLAATGHPSTSLQEK